MLIAYLPFPYMLLLLAVLVVLILGANIIAKQNPIAYISLFPFSSFINLSYIPFFFFSLINTLL